jgi:uncharacterized protein YndB with AHSA1/START domain
LTDSQPTAARVASSAVEIAINAPRGRVWKALTDETNAWWLPEFHILGAGSVVTLDPRAGGGLIEQVEGGGSLLWYTVLMNQPDEFTMHLVGHTAPPWGGPHTSLLQLTVEATGAETCLLKVHDARFGHIDEATIKSHEEGWTWLFTDGLKRFVEVGSIEIKVD